jgi:hypothetical protein
LAGFEAGAVSFGGEAIIARRHGPLFPYRQKSLNLFGASAV